MKLSLIVALSIPAIAFAAPRAAIAAPHTTSDITPANVAPADELKTIIHALNDIQTSQAEMNKQLQEIKSQLKAVPNPGTTNQPNTTAAATPAPANPPVAIINNIPYELTAEDRTTGPKDAKVVMLEFSDLQCGFCAGYHMRAFQDIMKNYVATGKIRYVYRDNPIPGHKDEMKFAQTARCAADKGKFWEAHDFIYRNQATLNSDNVTTQIAKLGIDVNELDSCVASGKKVAGISKDASDGMRIGATSTPTLFIALADGENKVKVVRKIKGAKPYEVFKGALDELLAMAPSAKP